MILKIEKIESVFLLMKQLRPNLTLDQYKTIYEKAHKADDYTLWGYYRDQTCIGALGLRTLYDYVHLKHLYIDDLVIDENHRSSGIGSILLNHAEKLAVEQGCTGLRLCTGNENHRGIQFYEKEKWTQRALVFKKKCQII